MIGPDLPASARVSPAPAAPAPASDIRFAFTVTNHTDSAVERFADHAPALARSRELAAALAQSGGFTETVEETDGPEVAIYGFVEDDDGTVLDVVPLVILRGEFMATSTGTSHRSA